MENVTNEKNIDLRNKLVGALIGLVRATEGNEYMVNEGTDQLILDALAGSVINEDFNQESVGTLLERILEEKKRLVPNCFYCVASCGRTDDFNIKELEAEDIETRELKLGILTRLQATVSHPEPSDTTTIKSFYRALYAIGAKDWSKGMLEEVLGELGELRD